jgi:hypothetical protein
MKTLLSVLFVLIFCVTCLQAQVSINNSGDDPDNSAMLDIKSTSRGLLIPRMQEGFRNAILNPAEGLLVYQTTGDKGLFINIGSPSTPEWTRISDSSNVIWRYHGTSESIYMDNNDAYLALGTKIATEQLHLTKSMEIPSTSDNTKGVIYKSRKRFIHNYGNPGYTTHNTFVGVESGNFTMSGSNGQAAYNTGFGASTLQNLTSGYNNTAAGTNALGDIENGYDNVGIGFEAMALNKSGNSNVAIGNYALSVSTTGNNNTAIGLNALQNTSGNDNTAIGKGAFTSNTSGTNNTIIGTEAGKGGASFLVNNNVMVGYRAGYSILTGADNNTIIGYEAGESLKAGSNNILIGYMAGDNITSGSDNIIIGHNLNAPSSTGDDQLNIGGLIYGDLDNKKVGIGTTNPAGKLHVRVTAGTCTMELESGNGRPILKMDAHSTTSNSEIQFEQDGTYKGALGYNNNDDNIFFYEDGSMVFRNGMLGILQTTPTYTLQLLNNATTGVALAYAWNTYSDKRINTNLKTMDYGLEEILLLEPKSYIHHPQLSEDDVLEIDRSTGTETVGLIAQEVYQIIPEAVRKPDNSELELWSMDYAKLVPVLINGIKELSDKNDQLQKQNEELLELYSELSKRVKALE